MKRFMVMGKTGCGKTTLLQRLYDEPMEYQKTQTVESLGASIDTPGEYLEQKSLYNALIVTALDADALLLVQAADDPDTSFPPMLNTCFGCEAVGVVTKIDMASDSQMIEDAKNCLLEAGAEQVFLVSAKTGEGIAALCRYVLAED